MTRFMTICSKLMYYLGLVPYAGLMFALTLMAVTVRIKEAPVLGVVIYGFAAIVLIQTILYVRKFVYGKIDVRTNQFIYGNLFFKRESPVSTVKRIGYYLANHNCYKIDVGGRWFI